MKYQDNIRLEEYGTMLNLKKKIQAVENLENCSWYLDVKEKSMVVVVLVN